MIKAGTVLYLFRQRHNNSWETGCLSTEEVGAHSEGTRGCWFQRTQHTVWAWVWPAYSYNLWTQFLSLWQGCRSAQGAGRACHMDIYLLLFRGQTGWGFLLTWAASFFIFYFFIFIVESITDVASFWIIFFTFSFQWTFNFILYWFQVTPTHSEGQTERPAEV